jgi:hypothetical protein
MFIFISSEYVIAKRVLNRGTGNGYVTILDIVENCSQMEPMLRQLSSRSSCGLATLKTVRLGPRSWPWILVFFIPMCFIGCQAGYTFPIEES